jgi:hypothetical protein
LFLSAASAADGAFASRGCSREQELWPDLLKDGFDRLDDSVRGVHSVFSRSERMENIAL